MTVNELVDRLLRIDGDKEVFIYCTYDSGYGTSGGGKIDVFEEEGRVELWNDEG